MKKLEIFRFIVPLLVLTSLLAAEEKWKSKPFTAWSEGEAKKVLNSSPWVKLGDLTSYRQSARMSTSGRAGSAGGAAGGRSDPLGGENLQRNIPYKLIWYSLVPRQASTRLIQLQRNLSDGEAKELVQQDRPGALWKFILITAATRGGGRGILEQMQETSVLIRDDGERIAAAKIEPLVNGPVNLYFPMERDGKPFLLETTKEFRLETQIGDLTLNSKFKIQDCLVEGKLAP